MTFIKALKVILTIFELKHFQPVETFALTASYVLVLGLIKEINKIKAT